MAAFPSVAFTQVTPNTEGGSHLVRLHHGFINTDTQWIHKLQPPTSQMAAIARLSELYQPQHLASATRPSVAYLRLAQRWLPSP